MDEAPAVKPLVAATCARTCYACPSQWEGRLVDGRAYYLRYRWGWLQVYVARHSSDDVDQAIDAGPIYEAAIGHGLNGYLADHEMRIHTAPFMDWARIGSGE